jgi:hypothetical protein
MREAVPLDAVAELSQTCAYDDLPDFLSQHREYASRFGFSMPTATPEQRERADDIRRRIQALETPGVPRDLEL